MPPLHSLIVVGDEVTLEQVAAGPALIVNGSETANHTLHNGDIIQIGSIEMLARIGAPQPASARVAVDADGAAEPEPVLHSAAELVERIERDQALIHQFESQQRLGADALATEIARRRNRRSKRIIHERETGEIGGPHFHVQPLLRPEQVRAQFRERAETHRHETEFLHDLEQLSESLGELSHAVQQTAARSSEREAGYAAATNLLLDAQQQLASQFELLLTQVRSLQEQQATAPRQRAIA
jgi:hypothetical protein